MLSTNESRGHKLGGTVAAGAYLGLVGPKAGRPTLDGTRATESQLFLIFVVFHLPAELCKGNTEMMEEKTDSHGQLLDWLQAGRQAGGGLS